MEECHDFFDVLGLFTNRQHTISVRSITHADLYKLGREPFETIVADCKPPTAHTDTHREHRPPAPHTAQALRLPPALAAPSPSPPPLPPRARLSSPTPPTLPRNLLAVCALLADPAQGLAIADAAHTHLKPMHAQLVGQRLYELVGMPDLLKIFTKREFYHWNDHFRFKGVASRILAVHAKAVEEPARYQQQLREQQAKVADAVEAARQRGHTGRAEEAAMVAARKRLARQALAQDPDSFSVDGMRREQPVARQPQQQRRSVMLSSDGSLIGAGKGGGGGGGGSFSFTGGGGVGIDDKAPPRGRGRRFSTFGGRQASVGASSAAAGGCGLPGTHSSSGGGLSSVMGALTDFGEGLALAVRGGAKADGDAADPAARAAALPLRRRSLGGGINGAGGRRKSGGATALFATAQPPVGLAPTAEGGAGGHNAPANVPALLADAWAQQELALNLVMQRMEKQYSEMRDAQKEAMDQISSQLAQLREQRAASFRRVVEPPPPPTTLPAPASSNAGGAVEAAGGMLQA